MQLNAHQKQIIVEHSEPAHQWLEYFFTENKKHRPIAQTNSQLIFSSHLLDAFIYYIYEHHDDDIKTNLMLAQLLSFKLTLSSDDETAEEVKAVNDEVAQITSLLIDLHAISNQQSVLLDNIEPDVKGNAKYKKTPPVKANPIKYNSEKALDHLSNIMTGLRSALTNMIPNNKSEKNSKNAKDKQPFNGTGQATLFGNSKDADHEKSPLLQVQRSAVQDKFIVAFNARSKMISIQIKDNKLFEQLNKCLQGHVQFIAGDDNTITLHYPALQKIDLGRVLTANLADLIPRINDTVGPPSPSIEPHREQPQEERSSSCCCSVL